METNTFEVTKLEVNINQLIEKTAKELETKIGILSAVGEEGGCCGGEAIELSSDVLFVETKLRAYWEVSQIIQYIKEGLM